MLTTVIVRKKNIPDMMSISMMRTRNGFASMIAPTGLVSMTSGADHAQKANPRDSRTTVRITVMIVDRTISLRSGISSLNVPHTGLESEMFACRT